MKFLEQVTTRLSIAVLLRDDSTPDRQVMGPVYLRAPLRNKPVKHSSGYYLLLDVPAGICRITAGGKYYQETFMDVNPAELDPKLPLVDMVLTPGPEHP